MKEYIIRWDAGYGDNYDIIEAHDHEEAQYAAYESWREDAENNADYEAFEATEEKKLELNIEG